MEREVIFNEVIYGLGALVQTLREARDERWRGTESALEYVKASEHDPLCEFGASAP